MAIPVFWFDFWSVLLAFLLLEAMLGMFNSCGATLRSRYYPEGLQSSVMSVFRLPLNLLVVLGTLLTNQANDVASLQRVFGIVVGMHLVATALPTALLVVGRKASSSDSTTGSSAENATRRKKKKNM